MSNLYIGTQKPNKIYVGTEAVKSVYLGMEKVWASYQPTDEVFIVNDGVKVAEEFWNEDYLAVENEITFYTKMLGEQYDLNFRTRQNGDSRVIDGTQDYVLLLGESLEIYATSSSEGSVLKRIYIYLDGTQVAYKTSSGTAILDKTFSIPAGKKYILNNVVMTAIPYSTKIYLVSEDI